MGQRLEEGIDSSFRASCQIISPEPQLFMSRSQRAKIEDNTIFWLGAHSVDGTQLLLDANYHLHSAHTPNPGMAL